MDSNHCSAILLARRFVRLAVFVAPLIFTCAITHAADINLIGVFGSKATFIVDGGKPRTLSPGETSAEQIRLVSVAPDSAVIEFDGKRQTIHMGNQRIGAARNDGGAQRVVLQGDAKGHFMTTVQVNGSSMRMLVDTGATSITISAADAKAASIDFSKAERGVTLTANGPAVSYRVKFSTVRVGDITLHNVDGMVMEGNALTGFGLLGMSFLSRTDMKREGETLTLVKRF